MEILPNPVFASELSIRIAILRPFTMPNVCKEQEETISKFHCLMPIIGNTQCCLLKANFTEGSVLKDSVSNDTWCTMWALKKKETEVQS